MYVLLIFYLYKTERICPVNACVKVKTFTVFLSCSLIATVLIQETVVKEEFQR